MVSATIGVSSLLIGDAVAWHHVPSVWRTWWLGDMGGDLIVAPALLVGGTFPWGERRPGRRWEAAILAVVVVGVSTLVFTQSTPMAYLLFPVFVWAALRFWQPGAVGASLVIATIAVTLTSHGHGPFARSGPDERLLLAQT